MNIFLSKKSVNEEFTSSDFVIKTQKQIIKDFGLTNVQFAPTFENTVHSYEDLIDIISEKLVEVMKTGETQLLQLLYQIDIPQNHFLELISKPELPILLSDLILRREAYKIHLRSLYS